MLGEKRVILCAIPEYMGCLEIDMETDNSVAHCHITMRVLSMDVTKHIGGIVLELVRAYTAGNVDYTTQNIAKIKCRTRGDTSADPREAMSSNSKIAVTN
jgi:hypothetical protein